MLCFVHSLFCIFPRWKYSHGIFVYSHLDLSNSLTLFGCSWYLNLDLRFMIWSATKAFPGHFSEIMVLNFITREDTAELFCFPMQWMLSRGQKKTGISWLVSTLLLMFIVVIAVKYWVGSMKELMKRPRGTRKESSYLKSQKLLRRTGSITLWPQSIHSALHIGSFMLCGVILCRRTFKHLKFVIVSPASVSSGYGQKWNW